MSDENDTRDNIINSGHINQYRSRVYGFQRPLSQSSTYRFSVCFLPRRVAKNILKRYVLN